MNENKVRLVGGVGQMKSNKGTQFYQQDRIYDSEEIALCQSANESFNPWYQVNEMYNPYNDKEITDIAPTQTTNCGNKNSSATVLKKEGLRIRKLTPKECWRLMGFDDEDFEKAKQVNSDSQLYKQAGNSIVVDVLEAIFKEML